MMHLKSRSTVASLVVVGALAAGLLGPTELAAGDEAGEAVVRRGGELDPNWLQSVLSWLDRLPISWGGRASLEASTGETARGYSEPVRPADPGPGVSPQGGADIDPDG